MPAIIPAAQRLTENHHPKKNKTRREKMWVTDRNGYKLHQTVVCFIEPPIPKARVLRYSFANQKMSLMYLSQTDILWT